MTIDEYMEKEGIGYLEVIQGLIEAIRVEPGLRSSGLLRKLKEREGDGTCNASFADVRELLKLRHTMKALRSAEAILDDDIVYSFMG